MTLDRLFFYCCFCDNRIIHSQRTHQMWYWWKELCLKPPRERKDEAARGTAGKNFDSIPSKSLQLGELMCFSMHIDIALLNWLFRFRKHRLPDNESIFDAGQLPIQFIPQRSHRMWLGISDSGGNFNFNYQFTQASSYRWKIETTV